MIVEFLEGDRVTLGFVSNHQAPRGRLELLVADGRSFTISPTRVLGRIESAEPEDKAARRILVSDLELKREALVAEVDLETLWSVLEGEGPDFSYNDLAGLNFGREPVLDDISAVLRAVHDDGLFFEFSPEKARRRDTQEIEKIKFSQTEKELIRKNMELGAEWLIDSAKGRPCPEPESADQTCGWLMDFVINGPDSKTALQTKELLSMASLAVNPIAAFDALVSVGRLSRHENVSYLRLGLKKEFDEEVLAEAQKLYQNFDLSEEKRIDLTTVPTATVDTPGAREFDDALSLESLPGGRVRLGLHIADVAAVVKPLSLVDQWARNQSSSIYLPEGRQPMLPDVLTENLASLKVGEVRPAFSLLATIDSAGLVIDYTFRPSLVYIDLQVSFVQASELLENGQGGLLEPLEELSQKLLAKRLANFGQNLALPHLNVIINAEGQIEVKISDDGNRASQMVGELMVLANHLAAKALMEASIACPYRAQSPSRPINWATPRYLNDRIKLALGLAKRRQMGRASLSMEPLPHHGLGISPYTSFTSPMRRYMDLLVARQLRALSDKKFPVYSYQEMLNLVLPVEATQKAIRKMQNERQRYWLAVYLQNKIGQEFVGLVYDRRNRRTRICVTEYMLEIELNDLPPEAQPGSEVLVRLIKVKPGPELTEEREEFWHFEFIAMC
ncbi:MAG: RNB domain-containing ribonuclease [Deltaproteobacteria bacterium]|nr:RNB domain-containing ribonuclease [Deltaproteobacteria bacterium]